MTHDPMLTPLTTTAAGTTTTRRTTTTAAGTSTTTVDGTVTLSIAGNTYTLTGTLGDDLIVEYHADFDQAISLGTVGAIAPSIANALSFPDLAKEITNTLNEVGSLPVIGQIGSILLNATARITDLEINTQAKTYGVGLALDFTQLPPNTPTPSVFGITLLSLGFKVTRTNPAQTSSTTPTSPTSPTSPTTPTSPTSPTS